MSVEAGWQPVRARHGLWLRAGANLTSGDRNSDDQTHGTFYPLLNTPRLYARTPFYGESGGQVGDSGLITGAGLRVRIDDSRKPLPNLIVHAGTTPTARQTTTSTSTGIFMKRGGSWITRSTCGSSARPAVCIGSPA